MTAPTAWWCPHCGHTVDAPTADQPHPEPRLVRRDKNSAGYSLDPVSSCCGASVVATLPGTAGFVPLYNHARGYENPRCGRCNAALLDDIGETSETPVTEESLKRAVARGLIFPPEGVPVGDDTPAPTVCAHANRAWTIGGPGDSDGYVWCPDCRTNLTALADEDPHYPDHQWVWVDGNNADAVVIYREWQRYQRASAERWEHESNQPVGDDTPAPTGPPPVASGWCIDAEGDAFYWDVPPAGADWDAHPAYPDFDAVVPRAAWRDLNEAVRLFLNRAEAAPELTALPTAGQVGQWLHDNHRSTGRHLYRGEIQRVLAAVAALVRDTPESE